LLHTPSTLTVRCSLVLLVCQPSGQHRQNCTHHIAMRNRMGGKAIAAASRREAESAAAHAVRYLWIGNPLLWPRCLCAAEVLAASEALASGRPPPPPPRGMGCGGGGTLPKPKGLWPATATEPGGANHRRPYALWISSCIGLFRSAAWCNRQREYGLGRARRVASS
jgi:hypothetical protein